MNIKSVNANNTVVATGTAIAQTPEEKLQAMMDFINGGVQVRRVLEVGEHNVVFNGITFDMAKMTATFSLIKDGEEFQDNKRFDPAKLAVIQIPAESIARQFGLQGDISFAKLNEYTGNHIKVWALIPAGKKTVCYNYYEPKAAVVPEAASTTAVDGKDF